MAFQWTETLETGNMKIDEQHKKLFYIFDILHNAIIQKHAKEAQRRTLEELADYVSQHFAGEETMMKNANYPLLADHKRKHDMLTKQTKQHIEDYKEGRAPLALTLSQFLSDWLKNHIMLEDKRMITWIREKTP